MPVVVPVWVSQDPAPRNDSLRFRLPRRLDGVPATLYAVPMTENSESSADQNFDRFVERVAQTGIVWGLYSESDGWANSPSEEFEDTDVILFWSDRVEAAAHQTEEWSGHEPREIAFDDFLDAWLQGMDGDGVLAGPNWTVDFEGVEVEAKELADRLLMERDA
jgi:hypothetical protein